MTKQEDHRAVSILKATEVPLFKNGDDAMFARLRMPIRLNQGEQSKCWNFEKLTLLQRAHSWTMASGSPMTMFLCIVAR